MRLSSCCVVVVSGCCVAVSGADPHVGGSSIGTTPLNAVYKAAAVKAFVDAASQRRVDIAGIGDSNQVYAGDYGHDYGVQKAWSDRKGMYGTGVLPFSGNNMTSWPAVGIGYSASSLGAQGWSTSPLPSQLSQYVFPVDGGFIDHPYCYLAPGESIPSDRTHYELVVFPTTPFSPDGAMRWHYTYATFPTGTAALYPTARKESTAQIIASKQAATGNGQYGLVDDHLDVPAGQRDYNVGFEPFKIYESPALSGSFFAQYQRADREATTKGIAYSTFQYQGGKAALHAAQNLQSASDTAIKEWLRQSVRLQNGAPMLMVNILHGGNDRNYGELSVGPHPAPSNTGPGFADNCEAIITRMKQVWIAAGYDPTNLSFVIGAYHPQDSDGTILKEFEEGAMALADRVPNVAVVRGTKLISPMTMKRNGYYASDGDAHLTPAGYENFDRFSVTQLISTNEPATGRSEVSSLSFTFDSDVSASLDPGDLQLKNLATNEVIKSADMSVDFDKETNVATWTFAGLDGAVLPTGNFSATLVSAGITDADGKPLAGGDYTFNFTTVPEPAAMLTTVVAAAATLQRRARGRCN